MEKVLPKPWEELAAAADPAPTEPQREERLGTYMTHELRAPLTSIRSALGYLQMQLEERLNPEERQALELAIKNSDRLDSLIEDIMDFSKIRAGKLRLRLQAVRAHELVQEAIESLRSWAISRGVRLIWVEPEEPLLRGYADPQRTVQVLINLLSNAIKFTPPGGKVEISACLGRFEHMGALLFKVKDTGPGIPRQDLERIFRCFEQSALGAKSSKGTGLGLTIAKALVEMQGGRIWAESWRGLGANFLFTIPILPQDLIQPVELYPKPIEYHGMLIGLYRRLNTLVTAFFA